MRRTCRLGIVASFALLAACSSSQKTAPASLMRVDAEAPGANCPAGGSAIRTGLDRNDDGVLQDAEVTATRYLCAAAGALVRLDPEPLGTNCPSGGTALRSGADTNGDQVLQDGEVTATRYVCVAASGLVRLDPEPLGTTCPTGGTAIRSGADTNGDRVLQDSEITATAYVCGIENVYRSGWAANGTPGYESGFFGAAWAPVGREATIFKTSATSRLRITVSDSLRVGYLTAVAQGFYGVRMNGADIGCNAGTYMHAPGSELNFVLPFAQVCLTEPLPPGLYGFDAWAISQSETGNLTRPYAGTGLVGWQPAGHQPVLLVEELAGDYAASISHEPFATMATTSVKAPGREVSFTKKGDAASTLLKVTLSDTLRASQGLQAGWGAVAIQMDGEFLCTTYKYVDTGSAANWSDFHNPIVVTCLADGVAPGPHTFSVWACASTATTGTTGELYLGYWSDSLLLVEELPKAGRSWTASAGAAIGLAGPWSQVPLRRATHTLSAAGKTLKVTYSDTFRAVLNCSDRAGFFQLYVDGQPTGCMNGSFASLGTAGLPQNHNLPVNLTCLVPDLAPGAHTFDVYSTTYMNGDAATTCGSNDFGWGRSQALLLVEELP